jgi:uncharacterized protein YybS (DUF2232 family)
MNHGPLFSGAQADDIIPLVCVMLGLALVALPAITLGVARRWSSNQPHLAHAILGGAIAITLIGILTTAFILLVVIGWIPPLSTLLGHGG